MKQDGALQRLRLVPPAPNVCATCAADHAPDEPHNRDSLYYQLAFYQRHKRWPTWADALAHCSSDVAALWRVELHARGVDVE